MPPIGTRLIRGGVDLRVAISCDGGVGFKTITELEEGSLKMYIHYPTVVTDGDPFAIVAYSLMGHPHLRQAEHRAGSKSPRWRLIRKSFQTKKYEPKGQHEEVRYTRHRRDKSEEDSAMKTTLSYELDGL